MLVLTAFVCAGAYFLIPAQKLQQLTVILPQMEMLGTLILVGCIYGIFALGSWVHHNLLLKTPGKTISALKDRDTNQQQMVIQWSAIATLSLPFSAFLTSLLSFQSKLLAYSLGWPGNRPWWIPAFLCLLPLTLCTGDLCWQLVVKLNTQRRRSPGLPPFPSKGGDEVQVTGSFSGLGYITKGAQNGTFLSASGVLTATKGQIN